MSTTWAWDFHGYDPKEQRTIESLCTLGNGRFATRGSVPESPAGAVHYPGTYAAGCCNWLSSKVAGQQVVNEDMVNLPDWSRLRYRCLPDDGPAGEWLTPDDPSLRHYKVSLDLRGGVLTRRLLFHDGHGRRLGVTHTRLVHMGDPYLAAQRTTFRGYGWSGAIEVESVIDGNVTNAGVERYRGLVDATSRATVPEWKRTASPGCPAGPARPGSGSQSPSERRRGPSSQWGRAARRPKRSRV